MPARLFTDHCAYDRRKLFRAYARGCPLCGQLFSASIVCFIHALIPGIFTGTGSRMVMHLHDGMVSKRTRPGGDPTPGADRDVP